MKKKISCIALSFVAIFVVSCATTARRTFTMSQVADPTMQIAISSVVTNEGEIRCTVSYTTAATNVGIDILAATEYSIGKTTDGMLHSKITKLDAEHGTLDVSGDVMCVGMLLQWLVDEVELPKAISAVRVAFFAPLVNPDSPDQPGYGRQLSNYATFVVACTALSRTNKLVTVIGIPGAK